MSPGDTIHIVIPKSAPDTSVATAANPTVTTSATTTKDMREYYERQEAEGNRSFTYLCIHAYSPQPITVQMLLLLVVIRQKV